VLGFLLAQVLSLRERVRVLAQQFELLKAARERVAAPQTQAARAVEPKLEETRAAAAVVEPSTPAPSRTRIEESVVRQQPTSAPAFAPLEPTAIDRAVEKAIAWIKGGNPLARIGIVILFFGATFLAKYAAEHSLFPIELRFMALAIGAFVLLIVGWRLRGKREGYAQLLQGGGVAGLYLTVFAATRLYQLLPMGFALALLIAVAVASAILAVAQNSLALAVIGTAGGFLAPILVSTGSGNYVALFTYYAILNVGVFTVAWFRTWRVLNVIGFVFTFTITALWRGHGYQRVDTVTTDAFLILFFLMYVAVSVLNCVRQAPNLKGYVSGTLVFGLPVVAFTLHASMWSRVEYALAWSALLLGIFYLLLGWTLFRTGRENFRLLVEAFAALGAIFGSLAIPLAFDATTTAAMWAVEGAGVVWLGVSQQRKLVRAFGVLLQLSGGLSYLSHVGAHGSVPIANGPFMGSVMIALAGMFSGHVLWQNRAQQAAYEEGADRAFVLWGLAWWLFAGIRELDFFLSQAWFGCALVFVSCTIALLGLLGIKREWPFVQSVATYLSAVAGVTALLYSAGHFDHPIQHWGALGWITLLATHFAWLYRRRDDDIIGLDWLYAGAVWLITLLLAWETHWQIASETVGVWSALPWGLVPALAVAWLAQRKPRPTWPCAAHEHAFRVIAAIPLVIAIGVWSLWANLTQSGDPRWLPYLPLLNPLDISMALAFVSIALWWTALSAQQQSICWTGDLRVLIAIAAGAIFLWLNSALVRALHHNFGAPLSAYGIAHSTLVQASLSIFWGVLGFAAMMLAAHRHWRYLWMVGAGLMIVVVAKLFLVDLSNVGTVARIASFISIGVLLLVTGYFAPLPPKIAVQTSEAS
jgi:uncharacterized membrane protein